MRDADSTQREGEPTTINRRTLLKGVGAAALAGTGAAAFSGTAAAAQTDLQIIEVDDSLFGWYADGSLPVVDELFVFIHGWFGNSTVESQANDVLTSVENAGYNPDAAVAIEWPASNLNYFESEGDTEEVAEVTADLIEEFYDSGGGSVRLTGHSLGGRTVCWIPTKIRDSSDIETIAALGAAADGSNVCDGIWTEGIAENANVFRNIHSLNDDVVGSAYGGSGDTALGTEGAGCDGPAGYADVDVTSSVGGHLEYLGDSLTGQKIAQAIDNS
ncbi:alpha/beta hydrolase [Halovenus sp. WSH3]|uniref:Alpha/beta hydrolase n=1 Tax=Halovenus carboxidivorans TaxID=2692199 RepID=A0A6B0T2W6_9EURY|nr:alpha/beta hydrolase [Halovenus carboxidivorans]MXR52345.1 alpha/beta hydrolase [Halovenus carboxidivorans]